MAERRMFAKTIIDSDAFLDMPLSAQALYFHLAMRADDDGFINNPKRIQRTIGGSDDDYKLLIAKNFVLLFESGIIVIKHWKIHNYIRGDRKKDTAYPDEMSMLSIKKNGSYTFKDSIKELPDKSDETDRQKAYRESTLPYSFDYKIRNAFLGKECPVCGIKMIDAIDEDGIPIKGFKPSIQHNIPISKGGRHELGNISVVCHKCNVTIGDSETGALNADEVTSVWECLQNDSQMAVTCQSNDSIGKDSIGKDSIDKVNNINSRVSDESPIDNADIKTIKNIIAYLNKVCGTRYRHSTPSTQKKIRARLKEGFTEEDFKQVIDTKYAQWGNDKKMSEYLRPLTLFGTKFESYLNQSISDKSQDEFESW